MGSDECLRRLHGAEAEISIHAPRVGSDDDGTLVARTKGISIHAPRVGSDQNGSLVKRAGGISIHAPRVGSDGGTLSKCAGFFEISIHAPRVGSDRLICCQTTLTAYFNPRSPCGERPAVVDIHRQRRDISIHAPRVGSDKFNFSSLHIVVTFQSTLPVWGATLSGDKNCM